MQDGASETTRNRDKRFELRRFPMSQQHTKASAVPKTSAPVECQPALFLKRMEKWKSMWHCYKPLMLVRPNISRDLHVKVLTEPRLAQLVENTSHPNRR